MMRIAMNMLFVGKGLAGGRVYCEGLFRGLFFFQAEDGIRVLYVTGVQTCAIPILRTRATPSAPECSARARSARRASPGFSDRKSLAQGKSVETSGRTIIKKTN